MKPTVTPEKSPRQLAANQATRLITSLLKVVLFLMRHGVHVIGFRGRRIDAGLDQVTVTVAVSPYLSVLFPDAIWLRQHHDGVLTIHTWFADRWGIRIEWEDVCPSTH